MPGYRDDYPGRRPQQMRGRGGHEPYGQPRRDSYNSYNNPPRRRYNDDAPPRRPRGDDYHAVYPEDRGYERPVRSDSGRSDFGRRPDAGRRRPDDEYIGRQRLGHSSGEYLADASDDRYYVESEPAPERTAGTGRFQRKESRRNDGYSSPAETPSDAPVRSGGLESYSFAGDFDDLDSGFDEVDEWYAAHSQPARTQEPAQHRRNREWSEENGFDGFEDDEDIIRSRSRRSTSPANDGWEQDVMPARSGFGDDYGGKKSKGTKGAVVVCLCGLLVLAVIGASILLFGRGSAASMNLDCILDTLTGEQTEVLVSAIVDKSLAQSECTVSVDGSATTFRLADCEITYVGKGGQRSSEYFTGTDDETGEVRLTEYAYSGVLRYNRTALREILDSQLESNDNPVSDPYFIVDYEKGIMTVHAGSDGWGVNVDTFLSQLTSALAGSGGGNVKVMCTSGAVPAAPLTAADIYERAATEPKDAYTTTDSAGNTIYHSEINGVDFDKSELERLLASGGTQWEIPVKVTRPAIDLREIKKYTFPDVLASYYTYYSPANKGRSHNLALAAEKIHSMILEPGEQFSFNGRVGERTPENGFRIAGVYAGEGNAEDYGGGICQTSSTLYYTCILANLQIDDRTNHIYTVGYMQTADTRRTVYGNDATVNWGLTDYKFTNSKEYPIRIDIWAKDGVLTCEIRGTADGLTADFEYETIYREPYKVKYLRDNGSSTQDGHDGYTVHVYRVIYKDGVEIERRLESKNNYRPMNKVYYTNDLPPGYEYGKEYPQDYVPPTTASTTGTTAPTSASATTTSKSETTTTQAGGEE